MVQFDYFERYKLIVTYLNYINCCKSICKISFTSGGVWTVFSWISISVLDDHFTNMSKLKCHFFFLYFIYSKILICLWSLLRSILISVTVSISHASLSWVTAISFILANVLLRQRQTKSILHESLTWVYNIGSCKNVFLTK